MIDLAAIKEVLAETTCQEDLIPPGATESELDNFEMRVGIRLAEDFRSWYMLTDGPTFTHVSFPSIRRTFGELSRLEIWLEFSPLWRAKGWLPIANDRCGNYYLLAMEGEFGPGQPVFFVEMIEDPDSPAYIVASGIGIFLIFVLHHNMGLLEWPFDREFVISKDPGILQFHGLPFPWDM